MRYLIGCVVRPGVVEFRRAANAASPAAALFRYKYPGAGPHARQDHGGERYTFGLTLEEAERKARRDHNPTEHGPYLGWIIVPQEGHTVRRVVPAWPENAPGGNPAVLAIVHAE